MGESENSVRKPFEQDEYDSCDQRAKQTVRKHLDRCNVYTHIVPVEDYGPDIQSMRHEHHEVEICRGWNEEWPEPWKDVHIPQRKERLLGKYEHLFFWMISNDLKRGWCIRSKHVKDKYLKVVRNSKIPEGEKMYCIPLKLCKAVEFKKKEE